MINDEQIYRQRKYKIHLAPQEAQTSEAGREITPSWPWERLRDVL